MYEMNIKYMYIPVLGGHQHFAQWTAFDWMLSLAG